MLSLLIIVGFLVVVLALLIYRRFVKHKTIDWQNVLVSLLMIGLAVLVTSIVTWINARQEPERWYNDAVLRKTVIENIHTEGDRFEIRKMCKVDLHGLDHVSLVVAGDEVSGVKEEFQNYKGKLAIFDKPQLDYNAMFALSGSFPMKKQLSNPRWVTFEAADLNADGKTELLTTWFDGSTTGFEKYVAVLGWDGGYKFLCTLPKFSPPVPEHSMIPPTGLSIKLLYNSPGSPVRSFEMRNCTYISVRDIDNDNKPEVLCAHMIWIMPPDPNDPSFESHWSPHRYIIRVLELYDNQLQPDMYWNKGEPLFLDEKIPTQDINNFDFSDGIINMGR